MDDTQKSLLIQALEKYVNRHPSPDKPMIRLGRDKYSPRQILTAIQANDEAGQLLIRVIENAVPQAISFEDLLNEFSGTGDKLCGHG
jgi:hypothetical protein